MKNCLSNGLLYAEIDGRRGPYGIGLQKGKIFSAQIKQFLQKHKNYLLENSGSISFNDLVKALIEQSDYLRDMEKYAPDVYQEMIGIADGSGAGRDDILLINFVEELFNLILGSGTSPVSKGCSTGLLFNRKELPNIAFMNADLFEYYTDFSVLYRTVYTDRVEFSLSYVGCFGPLCGCNDKGFCLVANSLLDGAMKKGSGLTALSIESELLHCSRVEEAAAKLEQYPRSAGVSYLLMDQKDAANIEATANALHYVREPAPFLQIHTNHLLASTDFDPSVAIYDRWHLIKCDDGYSSSCTVERYHILLAYLCAQAETATAETVVTALRKTSFPHPMCYTNCSMIYVADSNAPYILVSKGVSPDRDFVKVSF